jgi:hypothetical protein
MTGARESLDKFLQQEYGAFNPRFPGISLKFSSADVRDELLSYLISAEPPASAVGDPHHVYLRSALEHEMRHYHDFLLSPYSYRLFRLRMQVVANGSQAILVAKSLDGNCIPVPLLDWMTLVESERERYVAEWRSDFGDGLTPIHLPHASHDDLLSNWAPGLTSLEGSPEEFIQLATATIIAYARIDQLAAGFVSPGGDLSPRSIHEVSALTAQFAHILRIQGLGEALAFTGMLLESPLSYAKVWRTFIDLSTHLERLVSQAADGERFVLRVAMRVQTIATWCLLGNYDLDGGRACPTVRFALLREAFSSDPGNQRWSCVLDNNSDLMLMWDHWDAETGITPWRTSLAEARSMSQRGIAMYKDLRQREGGDRGIADLLVELIRDIDLRQESIVDTFLADPGLLSFPWRYAEDRSERLPMPPLRLETAGASAVFLAVPPDDAGRASMARAREFEGLSQRCDVVFSRHAVPDGVARMAWEEVQEITNKRLLNVF